MNDNQQPIKPARKWPSHLLSVFAGAAIGVVGGVLYGANKNVDAYDAGVFEGMQVIADAINRKEPVDGDPKNYLCKIMRDRNLRLANRFHCE